MNRLISNVLTIALFGWLLGCEQAAPTYTVCLVDVSKSITPEGSHAEFKAVDDLIDGMHRGDRLTIIPITGNAGADTPGAMVIATTPANRQAYDGDLLAFRAEAHRDIARLRQRFETQPTLQTDILGTLDIAQDEFDDANKAGVPEFRRSLYIFSDFIEDDQIYCFKSVQKDGAADLAGRIRRNHHLSVPDSTTVRLFKLQSSDGHLLHPDAQEWIRVFWSTYFLPGNVRWTSLGVSVGDGAGANHAVR